MHLLTVIGLLHSGSSTVHIYTQAIHKTTQSTQTIHRTTQLTNWEERGPCSVFPLWSTPSAVLLKNKAVKERKLEQTDGCGRYVGPDGLVPSLLHTQEC